MATADLIMLILLLTNYLKCRDSMSWSTPPVLHLKKYLENKSTINMVSTAHLYCEGVLTSYQ